MNDDINKTMDPAPEFDFDRFPSNTLFHDRREGRDRRGHGPSTTPPAPAGLAPPARERREKKERRRRIDPTTFEKQYTEEELEFMNAMQRFKELSGKAFPTYGDALKVAVELGYRRVLEEDDGDLLNEDGVILIDDAETVLEEIQLDSDFENGVEEVMSSES